jgi:hypothetical protein
MDIFISILGINFSRRLGHIDIDIDIDRGNQTQCVDLTDRSITYIIYHICIAVGWDIVSRKEYLANIHHSYNMDIDDVVYGDSPLTKKIGHHDALRRE